MTTPTNTNESWEEEFDNFMVEEYGNWKVGRAEVKDFIKSLISQQRKDAYNEAIKMSEKYRD